MLHMRICRIWRPACLRKCGEPGQQMEARAAQHHQDGQPCSLSGSLKRHWPGSGLSYALAPLPDSSLGREDACLLLCHLCCLLPKHHHTEGAPYRVGVLECCDILRGPDCADLGAGGGR